MNNFVTRTLTGTVFVIVLVGSVLIGQPVFAILFALVTLAGLYEFYKLMEANGAKPQWNTGPALGLSVYGAIVLSNEPEAGRWLTASVFLLLFLVFIVELYRKTTTPFQNIALTLCGAVYIAVPFGMLNRFYSGDVYSGLSDYGLLLGFLIILWTNDTGAYLVGSRWGKNHLFERISPKKSWEGSIGGGVFALIAAFLCFHLFGSFLLWQWLIIGLIIVVFGTFGDLAESMLKRSAGVKDSGNILPGHGGILDRFDAVLLAAPFVYIFVNFFC